MVEATHELKNFKPLSLKPYSVSQIDHAFQLLLLSLQVALSLIGRVENWSNTSMIYFANKLVAIINPNIGFDIIFLSSAWEINRQCLLPVHLPFFSTTTTDVVVVNFENVLTGLRFKV